MVSLGIEEEIAMLIAIANAHRLPRRESEGQASAAGAQAPPPIIARFCYMHDRNRILTAFEDQQRKRTRSSGETSHARTRITVRTDLPPAMKIRRLILANEAYKLRKEKGVSTRIFQKGTELHLLWKEKGTNKWNNHDM